MASGHPFAMSIENVDWASNGAADTPLGDAGVYQKIARKASAGRLSDEDRNTVNNLRSPFYGDAVNAIDKEYQAKLKESMDIYRRYLMSHPRKSSRQSWLRTREKVTRDGKIEGRPDLRDHDLFKKTIIEEVNRK